MKGMGSTELELNMFEYATLAEDTDPNATEVKVIVPKLSGAMDSPENEQEKQVDQSKFANSSDSKLESGSSSKVSGAITVKVVHSGAHRHKHHDCWPQSSNCPNATHTAFTCHSGTSDLVTCMHFHHDHHMPHLAEFGMIPKGTKVIVLFMDNNPNDGYLTRWLFEFPNGGTLPDKPYDAR